ncbi:MAG: hypothetical protein V2I26_13250 [Halieaceae bacterium]|nr:hypothetical protein [Halieaceae bacterium]
MTHLEIQHVGQTAPGHVAYLQQEPDNGGRSFPVFNVDKRSALAKAIRSVLCFNADTLPQVRLPDPLNQIVMQLGVFFQRVDRRGFNFPGHKPA